MTVLAQKGLPVTNLSGVAAPDAGLASGVGAWVALPNYALTRGPNLFAVDIIQTGGPPASVSLNIEGSNDGGVTAELIKNVTTVGTHQESFANSIYLLVRTKLLAYGAGGGTLNTVISV